MNTLTFKILPAHREALKRLSKDEQERVAVVVRRLIKEEAKKRGLWPNSQEATPCNN